MFHYVVNQYLSDCGLPHEPTDSVSQVLVAFYESIRSSVDDPQFAVIVADHCAPAAFRAMNKESIGNNPRIGQLMEGTVFAMCCAKRLASQGRSGAIPQLICIAEETIVPAKGSFTEHQWNALTNPLSEK